MRFSTTRLFPLALMLSLALLTMWLEHAVRVEEKPAPLRRHDPDYVVSNFTTTTYDPNGKVESILAAARMIHFPDDDSTDLVEPRVIQAKPDQPRVSVRAERGTLSREGDEIFLYDNVVLTREADAATPEGRMTTSFLHILRDRGLVRTDREVHFEEPGRSLSGRGMEYHTDTRELYLANDVKGVMEPKAP
ncbi:MAG TPA: LPS export ABC transporter periplasmic protein LptC [Burkholderiales bacterium]|nr:LPS export ABC transporter periplasmic protein LptC [Burkholderiales bacterium]